MLPPDMYIPLPYNLFLIKELTANDIRAYAFITAFNRTGKGMFRLSNAQFANEIGVSLTTIKDTLCKLKDLELITIMKNKSNQRTIRSNKI